MNMQANFLGSRTLVLGPKILFLDVGWPLDPWEFPKTSKKPPNP